MTTAEYNALPAEARRFIETHAGCLSCGNAESKLTRAYELYKNQKMAQVYVLFGGGINYSIKGKKGVLYNVRDTDTPFEIREKLDIAARIHEASPEVFMFYDEKAIAELLESLPAEKVVNLTPELSEEEQAAWATRSGALGIDTKSATYDELKDYVKVNAVEAKSQKKGKLIEAIDAIEIEAADANDLN